jgi:hypothetical protein
MGRVFSYIEVPVFFLNNSYHALVLRLGQSHAMYRIYYIVMQNQFMYMLFRSSPYDGCSGLTYGSHFAASTILSTFYPTFTRF